MKCAPRLHAVDSLAHQPYLWSGAGKEVIQLLPVGWCEASLAPRRVLSQSAFTVGAAQDRLATLEAVRAAGISVCAGGIIGLGEGPTDRVGLLHQLATLRQHPESVPINALARRPLLPWPTPCTVS